MEPKHQFAAQYMLSRAAAERRFRSGSGLSSERDLQSPGPGTSDQADSSNNTGHGGAMDTSNASTAGASPAASSSAVNNATPSPAALVNNRLTSPLASSGRSPASMQQSLLASLQNNESALQQQVFYFIHF